MKIYCCNTSATLIHVNGVSPDGVIPQWEVFTQCKLCGDIKRNVLKWNEFNSGVKK